MKKKLIGVVAIIGVLILVLVTKTLTYPWKKQGQVDPVAPRKVDADELAVHLAEAVRFRTVSHQDPSQNDAGELLALHDWLQKTYPAALFPKSLA